MPSPWRVLEIARGCPTWPTILAVPPCMLVMRDVRAADVAISAGAIGEAIARAIHTQRNVGIPFDALSAQERATLNAIAGHVRAAVAATPGRIIERGR